MDVVGTKSAIVREVTERLKISGGVEAFRRLVGGRPEVVERALTELVAEGWLKEVPLRVGKIYFYPPNVKPSQALLYQALRSPGGAPVREAPARRTPEAPAAGAAVQPTVPAPPAGAAPAFSGPVKAKKKSELAAEAAAAATAGAPVNAPAPPPAPPVPATTAPVPPSPAATGPVKAKKKSQLAAEAAAAAGDMVPGTEQAQAPVQPEETSDAAATAAVAEPGPVGMVTEVSLVDDAPKVYTGPIKAKKKSEGG